MIAEQVLPANEKPSSQAETTQRPSSQVTPPNMTPSIAEQLFCQHHASPDQCKQTQANSLRSGTLKRRSSTVLAVQASTARLELVIRLDALESAGARAGETGASSVGAQFTSGSLSVEADLLADRTLGPDGLARGSVGGVRAVAVIVRHYGVGCAGSFARVTSTATGTIVALAGIGIAIRLDIGAAPVHALAQAGALVRDAGDD